VQVHTPSIDAVLARIAASQHGVLALAQLLAAGLSQAMVARRVATGRLHRIHRGVYALGHAGLSLESQLMAAVLALGDGAAISHLSAARLMEISRFRSSLIAAVTVTRRHPQGVEAHRTKRLDPRDITKVKGIPCTTIPRTLVDLTDVLTPHQLANVIHQAAYTKRFNLEATEQAIRRANGRTNLHVLHEAIDLHLAGSAGTRSGEEDQLLHQLQLFGIETPIVNTELHGVEVDLQWPGLVIEVDGPGHERPRTRRDDAQRDARLQARGYRTVRVKRA